MKKQTDTFKRLRAVMKDINGDLRQIIRTMQDKIEYLMESYRYADCQKTVDCFFPSFMLYLKKILLGAF